MGKGRRKEEKKNQIESNGPEAVWQDGGDDDDYWRGARVGGMEEGYVEYKSRYRVEYGYSTPVRHTWGWHTSKERHGSTKRVRTAHAYCHIEL